MLVIAENINVMTTRIGTAMKERDKGPIQDLAKRLVEGGADVIDINLGPARKNGDKMMEFVVETVAEMAAGPPPKGQPEKFRVAIFGHCARCMHLEHITIQEVEFERIPETVQSVPGADPAAGTAPRSCDHRRSAAGG